MYKGICILFVTVWLTCGMQVWGASEKQAPAKQSDMISVFINLPDSLTPYLARTMREDMADYFKSSSDKRVDNMLEGESYLMAADSCNIEVCLARDKSFLTLKRVLTVKGDTLYAVIETASSPARDSRISFYDVRWLPLKNSKIFSTPVVKDFFKESSSAGAKEALKLVNISFIELTALDGGRIKASFTDKIKQYLPEEICNKITPYLKDEPLYYVWDGKSFHKKAQN
ncbi:MAG: DUF3256 family protein [Bacteroidales bacterium]